MGFPKCTITQCSLFVINFVLFVCGVILLVNGLFLKYSKEFLHENLHILIENLQVEEGGRSIKETITLISNLFIGIGLAVLILSILGSCGAMLKMRVLLGIYTLVMVIVIVVLVTGVTITMYGKYKRTFYVDKMIARQLKKTYRGYNNTDPITLAWNYMFFEFKCCGGTGYHNFKHTRHWQLPRNYKTPIYCCKRLDSFKNLLPPITDDNWNCAKNPTKKNSNFKKGCAAILRRKLYENEQPVVISGIVVIVLNAFCCVLSIWMLCTLKSKDYTGMD